MARFTLDDARSAAKAWVTQKPMARPFAIIGAKDGKKSRIVWLLCSAANKCGQGAPKTLALVGLTLKKRKSETVSFRSHNRSKQAVPRMVPHPHPCP